MQSFRMEKVIDIFKTCKKLSWKSILVVFRENFPTHHFEETSNEYQRIKRLYDNSLKLRGTDLDELRAKEFKCHVNRAAYMSNKLLETPRKKEKLSLVLREGLGSDANVSMVTTY